MTSVLGSTHVVEQLSFSMFPSTLAFDFDLMLGSFLTFWAIMGNFFSFLGQKIGYFDCWVQVQIVLGSTH